MTSSFTVLSNLCWLLLGPLLRLAVGIPLAGFTAYYLGLSGYGEFNVALAFVVMFSVLANLGLNEVLTRAVAQRPEEAQTLWSSVVAFKVGPLSGYVGVVVIVVWFLGYSPTVLWLVLLLGMTQWTISLDNCPRAVFAGQQRMQVLGGMDVAKVLLETALSVAVLLLGCGAIALAGVRLMVAVTGFVLAVCMLSSRLQVQFARPRLSAAVALLPAGCRFAATSAILGIYERVGFVFLAHLMGTQAVALVSTATTLTEKIFWFVPALQGAIFPFFSCLQVAAQDRFGSAFARALRYQTVIAVGCGLAVSLLGPWVIRLVFPEEFWLAGSIVRLLGWMCVPKLIASFLLTVLQSLGQERQVGWISGVQCGVYICTTLVLVSLWGIFGFAWAYLVAETTALLLQGALLYRLGILSEEGLLPLLCILGSGLALFFAAAWIPGGRNNFWGVFSLMACYPLLIVVSRSVSGEDVRYLQGLWVNDRPSTA